MLKQIKNTRFFPVLTKGVKDRLGYPPNHSEFEVQAFIFENLKRFGYDIRGEVPTTKAKCRFDLVIFHALKPVVVIEVKKRSSKKINRNEKARRSQQASKYDRYCTHVFFVCGMKEAKSFVNKMIGIRRDFNLHFENLLGE